MNARRTYADEDYEEAEKYYGIVREELPDNLEAMFLYLLPAEGNKKHRNI